MNSYSRVRVGSPGQRATRASNCCAGWPAHPHADVRLAMASGASEAKRVPALKRIWDAPVEPLDVDRLAAETDAVFLALPDTLAAEVGPALARRARASSICRGRSGCATASCATLVSALAGSGLAGHLRPDRALPGGARHGAARRLRRLLSDGRDPGAAAARRRRAARAGHHHRRQVGRLRAPARRRPSARTSPSATAASPRTACSRIATRPRSSRSSGCRSRSCRTSCRSIAGSSRRSTRGCSPASTRRRSSARCEAAYADSPFVRLTGRICPRSSTSRTRTSATSAGASTSPAGSS